MNTVLSVQGASAPVENRVRDDANTLRIEPLPYSLEE